MNKKVKLIEKREERGLTQKDMAERLNMAVSGYTKRENGQTKISISNWVKAAKILNCPIEDIYEEDEKQSFTIKDNATGKCCANNINTIQIIELEDVMETYKKYIKKLEEENAELKRLLKKK